MELLLNIAWLFLALPAYWVWRGRQSSRACSSLQCLLALGCVLVILFPVISATDDLLVMRTEMEESPASKRSLRQGSIERLGAANPNLQVAAAVSSPAFSPRMEESIFETVSATRHLPGARALTRPGRAPPVFSALLG